MPRPYARNTKVVGWSRCPSTEQIYPLWEQLATILASEWPIARKEYSDVNHGGLVHVVSDFNHQLERVVRVVQDALCDAQ